jgi:4-hydroxybenzoate polyprenyltransferase
LEVQDLQSITIKQLQVSRLNLFREFANDIKLSHSIFALPFVGVGLTRTGIPGIGWINILLIICCMVFARSFAMGMNRYLDRDIDSGNERTKVRALPSGKVGAIGYLSVTLVCGILFIATSFSLSPLAGWLSPALLVVLMSYSFMKRISWLTHWYLGVCLGLAPVATQIALFGEVTLNVVLVGLAVAFWTAGFDLLYSLQDREFDRSKGLHSVPAKLGHRWAIWMSRGSFLLMVMILSMVGFMDSCGLFWWFGVAIVAVILAYEHWVIREAMTRGTSDKINIAFFNLNALVSVLFFICAALDFYVSQQ